MFSKVHTDSLNSKPEDTPVIITEWLDKSQYDINIAAFSKKLLISSKLSLLAQQSMFPTIPHWLAFVTLPFLSLLPGSHHLHSLNIGTILDFSSPLETHQRSKTLKINTKRPDSSLATSVKIIGCRLFRFSVIKIINFGILEKKLLQQHHSTIWLRTLAFPQIQNRNVSWALLFFLHWY